MVDMRRRGRVLIASLAAALLAAGGAGHAHSPARIVRIAPPFAQASMATACDAPDLGSCVTEPRVDRRTGSVSTELSLTSPAQGVLPGSGSATTTSTLVVRHRLTTSVQTVLYSVELGELTARVAHTLAGVTTLRDGDGTRGRMEAKAQVTHSRCRRCTSMRRIALVDTACGIRDTGAERQDRSRLLVGLYNARSRVPPGIVTLTLTFKGSVSLGRSATLPDRLEDSGVVRLTMSAAATRVTAEIYDDLAPGFVFLESCFWHDRDPGGPHPSLTYAAGGDVVAGSATLLSSGRYPRAGEVRFIAQAAGIAIGTPGTYVPGWFEALVDAPGIWHRVYRGSLSTGDLTFSADHRSATLRIPFEDLGTFSVIATAIEPEQISGGIGMGSGEGFAGQMRWWEMDADMFQSAQASLNGTVGRYKAIGFRYSPADKPFVFLARAGYATTCQDDFCNH